MNQFEKFNENAKKILKIADRIASEMNASTGTDHILLALASDSENLASEFLRNININVDRIHLAISLSRLNSRDNSVGMPNETKKLLEKSLVQAKALKQTKVGPEHLLLALLSDSGSLGYRVLEDLGIDCKALKNEIIQTLLNSRNENNIETENQFPSNSPANFAFSGGVEDFEKLGEKLNEFFEEPFFNKTMQTVQQPKSGAKSALDYFTIDLNKKAAEGVLDPIIGRHAEIERVLRILNRRTKNNPVLVGDAGVGKTAIVEGLAQKIINHQVPRNIANKRILVLDLALLLAGTKYRGEFEERIKKVTEEIINAKDIILFIDEIHTIVGAGSAEGAMDAANILKPALTRGDLRLIGATTLDDYRKFIEKDPALERRLQMVKVDEPTPEDTYLILKGLRKKYEEFHDVDITNEALKSAVELSTRYISDRFLPDKAVDLIDEAASQISLFAEPKTSKTTNLKEKYRELEKMKDQEVEKENFKRAAEIKMQQNLLRREIMHAEPEKKKASKTRTKITSEDIAKVVSEWTKIPVSSLIENEAKKFKNLDKILNTKIKGQDEAVQLVAQAIKRSRTGVSAETRPLGSFIFMGPTGVGKTELAKVLASEIFESPDSLIKIDMSEFMEKHNVSRLIGAPPGYVGYDDAGKLTEAVRRRPYSVVLFDEIEKAHPDIQNILLQILEDGYLTDAKGRRVNFRNTIIIMTSNIGMRELTTTASVGFNATGSKKEDFVKNYDQMKDKVMKDLKQFFRPEFLNRVDRVVVFKPLGHKEILEIVNLRLSELTERLKAQNIQLKFSDAVKEKIADVGFDPENGARPIRRAISDLIEDPLSEEILQAGMKKKRKINIDLKDNKVVFR